MKKHFSKAEQHQVYHVFQNTSFFGRTHQYAARGECELFYDNGLKVLRCDINRRNTERPIIWCRSAELACPVWTETPHFFQLLRLHWELGRRHRMLLELAFPGDPLAALIPEGMDATGGDYEYKLLDKLELVINGGMPEVTHWLGVTPDGAESILAVATDGS